MRMKVGSLVLWHDIVFSTSANMSSQYILLRTNAIIYSTEECALWHFICTLSPVKKISQKTTNLVSSSYYAIPWIGHNGQVFLTGAPNNGTIQMSRGRNRRQTHIVFGHALPHVLHKDHRQRPPQAPVWPHATHLHKWSLTSCRTHTCWWLLLVDDLTGSAEEAKPT